MVAEVLEKADLREKEMIRDLLNEQIKDKDELAEWFGLQKDENGFYYIEEEQE